MWVWQVGHSQSAHQLCRCVQYTPSSGIEVLIWYTITIFFYCRLAGVRWMHTQKISCLAIFLAHLYFEPLCLTMPRHHHLAPSFDSEYYHTFTRGTFPQIKVVGHGAVATDHFCTKGVVFVLADISPMRLGCVPCSFWNRIGNLLEPISSSYLINS